MLGLPGLGVLSGFGACPPAPPPTVTAMVDDLLARAGDSLAFGTSRGQAERLLEHAAGIVNAELTELTREADITVSADSGPITISTTLTDCVRILEIRDGQRELKQAPWPTLLLSEHDSRALGDRAESWAYLGRDSLWVHPPLTASKTLTVRYAYQPDLVECAQFDNPTLGRVLAMAEMLLCVRTRDLTRLVEIMGDAPPAPPMVGRGTQRPTVGDAIDDLLGRQGDGSAFGTSREQAKRLIEHAIGIVQANMPDTTTTTTLAVGANDPFVVLSSAIPDAARVVEIEDSAGREIDRADWETILASTHEPLALGDRLEAWGYWGRDLLFLWPPLTAGETVTVVYSQQPSLGADATTISQDNMGKAMLIAEALLCVRTRNTERLAEIMESV